jgi:hypothetical protein
LVIAELFFGMTFDLFFKACVWSGWVFDTLMHPVIFKTNYYYIFIDYFLYFFIFLHKTEKNVYVCKVHVIFFYTSLFYFSLMVKTFEY